MLGASTSSTIHVVKKNSNSYPWHPISSVNQESNVKFDVWYRSINFTIHVIKKNSNSCPWHQTSSINQKPNVSDTCLVPVPVPTIHVVKTKSSSFSWDSLLFDHFKTSSTKPHVSSAAPKRQYAQFYVFLEYTSYPISGYIHAPKTVRFH